MPAPARCKGCCEAHGGTPTGCATRSAEVRDEVRSYALDHLGGDGAESDKSWQSPAPPKCRITLLTR
jgi:hypothetical protein